MYPEHAPIVVLPETLSDETIVQLLELLHELTRVIEHHYADQIHRYRQLPDDPQPDLWDDQDLPF